MIADKYLMIEHRPAAERTGGLRMGRAGGRQRGMTLVEVMVAMVIGLLLTIVAGTVFLASRQSFRVQDNFAQLQEGGRAVLEDVSREIRKAGSYGCFRWKNVTPPMAVPATLPNSAAGLFPIPMKNLTEPAIEPAFDVRGGAVSGLTLPSGSGITPVAGSEFVQVTYGQPVANLLNAVLPANPTAPLTLNHGITAATGQPFLLADCEAMTLFRVDSTASGAAGTPLLHAPPTNNVAWAALQHPPGSTIMTFHAVAFFIGTDDASGVRNLYRWDRPENALPQALVANVDDMRVIFGVDGNTGEIDKVTQWLAGGAVTAWERVLTVAVHVVMRSNDSVLAAAPISFTWNATKKIFEQGTSGSDYVVRRPYIINAVIRSRAPIMS